MINLKEQLVYNKTIYTFFYKVNEKNINSCEISTKINHKW